MVSADWELVPSGAEKLARLQLTDRSTKVAVDGLFTREDLANVAADRYPFFRLWDDLLRERGRKLMQGLEFAGDSGA